MNNKTFNVREYGRTELAQLYSPGIEPDSAWRKFNKWISRCPGLTEKLESLGYDGTVRSFTPAQVQAIVETLGEP